MSLTERIAWFACPSGIAGDMALGALIDAGADIDDVVAGCNRLGLDGWHLSATTVARSAITATRVEVTCAESHHHRGLADIRAILDAADLPARVHARAVGVFVRLAAAEAEVHGCTPDEVHFHEVGAVDALIDVVGTCAALESLGIDRVTAGRVALGSGTATTEHGLLPVPAPAVTRLLAGAPVSGGAVEAELTTPTGAALLAELVDRWGPVPDMTLLAGGLGAGSRNPEHVPNVVQVLIGEAAPAAGTDEVVVIEANLDDVTGEVLAHTIARLMEEGARDAWVSPTVMKKGRPAHSLHALADPALVPALAEVIFAETGTLGLRTHTVQRMVQPRRVESVRGTVADPDSGPLRVKHGPHGAKVEFDDARAEAARTGTPLRGTTGGSPRDAGSRDTACDGDTARDTE